MHRERINNQRNIVSFHVGDAVMARWEVQSNKSANKVGKLCYQVRGPFTIVKPTGTGGYIVTKFGKPDGPQLKYMAEELYALPPTLLPCDPVDGSDIRYLNHSHPSVPNPLKDVLDIVSYDTMNFSSPHLTVPPKFDYDRDTLQFIHPSEPTPFPSIVELHDESNTVPPSPIVDPQSDICITPHTPHALSLLLPASDRLFFIQYVPIGSIRPRWFLVQILLDLTLELNLDPVNTGHYLCSFLARHPSDNKKKDNVARWWPEWHEYTTGDDNIPIFGKRVLFHPHRKPDLAKHRLWTDTVPLSNPNCFLSGPFSFEARQDVIHPCNFVARSLWEHLFTVCSAYGIVPPTLSDPTIQGRPSLVTKPKRAAPVTTHSKSRKSPRFL